MVLNGQRHFSTLSVLDIAGAHGCKALQQKPTQLAEHEWHGHASLFLHEPRGYKRAQPSNMSISLCPPETDEDNNNDEEDNAPQPPCAL